MIQVSHVLNLLELREVSALGREVKRSSCFGKHPFGLSEETFVLSAHYYRPLTSKRRRSDNFS